MKIYKYEQYLKEGLVSRGLEFIHRNEIKEADKIADKWIDRIYSDYKEKGNILAAALRYHNGYVTLEYRITEDPYGFPGVVAGDYYIDIKLTSIKDITGWKDDITKARLQIEVRDEEFLGPPICPMIGRDMETNKLVYNEKGIQGNSSIYGYVNISQGKVDKLIDFFKKEWERKVPKMKGEKYFIYTKAFEKDDDLAKDRFGKQQEYHTHVEEEKVKQRKIKIEKGVETLNEKMIYDSSEIKSYLQDYCDYFGNDDPDVREINVIGESTRTYTVIELERDSEKSGLSYLEKNKYQLNKKNIMEVNSCYYVVTFGVRNMDLGKVEMNLPNNLKIVFSGFVESNHYSLGVSIKFQVIIKQL